MALYFLKSLLLIVQNYFFLSHFTLRIYSYYAHYHCFLGSSFAFTELSLRNFAVTQNFLLFFFFFLKLTKYYLNVTYSEALDVEINVVDFKGCH